MLQKKLTRVSFFIVNHEIKVIIGKNIKRYSTFQTQQDELLN
jgi:hypothetical protein